MHVFFFLFKLNHRRVGLSSRNPIRIIQFSQMLLMATTTKISIVFANFYKVKFKLQWISIDFEKFINKTLYIIKKYIKNCCVIYCAFNFAAFN